MRELVAIVGPTGEIREVNATAAAFFGTAADAIVGRLVWEWSCWDAVAGGRERVRDAVGRAARGEHLALEVGVRAAGGRAATLDAALSPVYADDGSLSHILAEGRDISERKRMDDALRASEARYAGILAIAADAIISVDERHIIRIFNRGAEEIFRYAPEEAIGQHLSLLLPKRFHAAHDEHMRRFASGPVVARRMGERREIFGLRKGGEEFPAEASISHLQTPDGPLFTVVLRDITDRKRSELQSQLLAEAGGALSASLDLDATLRTVVRLPVPRFADACFVDYFPADGTRARVASAHPDPDTDETLRWIEEQGTPADDSPSAVVEVLRTGRPILVSAVAANPDDAPDQPRLVHAGILGLRSFLIVPLVARHSVIGALTCLRFASPIGFDESDFPLAEELAARSALAIDNAQLYLTAQRASRLRDEVLGVVSHDLRNPVSAIAMCAKVLAETPPDSTEERQSLLGAIRDSTEWMNRMIQDLLDVTSIEAGRLAVDRRREDVDAIIETAVGMFAAQAERAAIDLAADVAPDLPPVLCDAERILQVVSNLVGNAVKFTPPGGRIVIAAHRGDDEVVVSVRDSGAGIPADHLPHLFERYWQARKAARKRGAGLGLAIVKGIVDAHGSRIWVASTPGEGSTFTFTLPISPAPHEAAESHAVPG